MGYLSDKKTYMLYFTVCPAANKPDFESLRGSNRGQLELQVGGD